MSTDNAVAILLALAAAASAWAMLYAPAMVPKSAVEGSFYVGIAAALAMVGAAAYIASGGSKFVSGIGVITFGCLFLGFGAWFVLGDEAKLALTNGDNPTATNAGGQGGVGPLGANGGSGGHGPVPGGGGAGGIMVALPGGGHLLTGGAGGGGAAPPGGIGGDGGSVHLGIVKIDGGKGANSTAVTSVNQSGGQTAETITNHTTINIGSRPGEREADRRRLVIQAILNDYVLSHDGIPPLQRDLLVKAESFINDELARREEPWRLTDQTKLDLKLPR